MALTGTLAVLAIACSLLAWRYQEGLIEASRYNAAFDFSQATVELLRLQVALEEEQRGAPGSQVELRFSILQNRVGIIKENSLFQTDHIKAIGALQAALDQTARLLAGDNKREGLASAIRVLQPYASQLLRLASQAHSESGDVVMRNQQDLRRIMLAICSITLTLVVFGTALIALVLRQYKRLDGVARTDALTGLANRFAFNRSLQASSGLQRAVVLVDVDHFKAVNDTLGHEAGDRLLCRLTERLRASSRGATCLARIGGDEFAVLFSGPAAAAESVAFAERVHATMREPIVLDGRGIVPSVTQGLCVADDHDRSQLFNNADIALYAAKTAGRDRYLVFEPIMKAAFIRRQQLREDMRQATARGELFLVFQPIVRLSDGTPQGVEALLRWQHPQFGLVMPSEFIPVAEESGLIQDIGRWIVDEACRNLALLPTSLFVAVNVSARQLADGALACHVAERLAVHKVSSDRLEIEITESIFIENDAAAFHTLERLRAVGCRIALDDFGTGYASLSYLRRFKFDKLKIDQFFVRDMDPGGDSDAILSMICTLARRLNVVIVAEGIETERQRDAVRRAGGQLGQGYYFHRPMAASALTRLIDDECSEDERWLRRA